MQYVIMAPAIANGVIPLQLVVDAMARESATAGGTPFHEPTFRGRFKRYAQWLLDDAKEGRLAVCDSFGRPSSVKALRAEDANVVVLESFDSNNPDNSPVDEIATLLLAVHTREKWLNDWAATIGNSFAIEHAGVVWIDERGEVMPPPQSKVAPELHTPSAATKPVPRHRAQEAAILAKLAELGFDAKALPPALAGKPSKAKQAVRDALGYSKDVFDKAWQRLRNAGAIADAQP